jgi:SAM-dependent methyltransferase
MCERVCTSLQNVSIQRWRIHNHLADFSAAAGRCSCILDVGSGESSPYRDAFDHDTYISLDRFERASVIGDAGALPFPSAQADLVLCTEVLEHLPEPDRALAEMNRVRAPAGLLIVTVPLMWGEHDHVDYQRWTEAGLRRLLQSAGLEVQEVRRRGGIFTMLGSMITKVPNQVFGTWASQRNWLLRIAYGASWLLSIPVSWLLVLFDPLDRTRTFTTGFSVLCHKPDSGDKLCS